MSALALPCTPAEPVVLDGLTDVNRCLEHLSAAERVEWSLRYLPGVHVMSSSFGAQAAVSLHLLTQQAPELPVILVDTGYLFDETYRFVETLKARLDLNLHVVRAERSPAWQEAIDGQRWLDGVAGLDAYHRETKIEPMQRALATLGATTWFAGLRRHQSTTRQERPVVERAGERFKVYPIVDWTDRDVHEYLKTHDLPYHPLWHEGYLSIGDHHTSRSIHEVDDADALRFFGLKRECGLHTDTFTATGADQ
ncbi:MAG: phosphoadenylyl-sulfate reductase [Pseudomonadota bacterium]